MHRPLFARSDIAFAVIGNDSKCTHCFVDATSSKCENARWFSIDALPDLPEAVHISRLLIDDTLAHLRKRR